MPRKKTAVFVTVITALLVVMVLSVAMSVHHYEKTVLITLDAAGEQAAENETGLAEIRRQLEAAQVILLISFTDIERYIQTCQCFVFPVFQYRF